MWDGQWHYEITPYAWVPWIYATVQLPAIAGGDNPTIEIQPSQYLKHVEGGALFDGMVRKGDWSAVDGSGLSELAEQRTHAREMS